MSSPIDSQSPENNPLGPGVVARPLFQLRSLPVQFRWEVTRRHPYYQVWWEASRAYHRKEQVNHPVDPLLRQAAVVILGAIGVSGEPPDPAKTFKQLGAASLHPAWLSGAMHPVTHRGLAALLIAALPSETIGQLALVFARASGDEEEGKPSPKITAMLELTTLDMPGLDMYTDEPFVSINPAASARQLTEVAGNLLKRWKQERSLREQRDRSDKYPTYLKVWDLREGWTGATYDRSRELKFNQIARELRQRIPTINNHYRSAFELIVGHPYSPDLWYRTLGPLKLTELSGQDLGPVSKRRPIKIRSSVPVPESCLQGNRQDDDDGSGPATSKVGSAGDLDVSILIGDIRTLIERGLTDSQVVDELGLSAKAASAVAYLRNRGDEPV